MGDIFVLGVVHLPLWGLRGINCVVFRGFWRRKLSKAIFGGKRLESRLRFCFNRAGASMDGRRSGLWLERSGGQGLHFRFLSARIEKAVNVDASAAMATVFPGVCPTAIAAVDSSVAAPPTLMSPKNSWQP